MTHSEDSVSRAGFLSGIMRAAAAVVVVGLVLVAVVFAVSMVREAYGQTGIDILLVVLDVLILVGLVVVGRLSLNAIHLSLQNRKLINEFRGEGRR